MLFLRVGSRPIILTAFPEMDTFSTELYIFPVREGVGIVFYIGGLLFIIYIQAALELLEV